MGYVEKNLISGENVLYRTKHHWIVLLGPVFTGGVLELAGIAILFFRMSPSKPTKAAGTSVNELALILAVLFLLCGSVLILVGVLKRNATEMVVTNKRIMIKTGVAVRKTFEMLLSRIESIAVEEPFWGRLLGYGTVIVRGVGGTPESFTVIAHPLEFRNHVQQQIESAHSS